MKRLLFIYNARSGKALIRRYLADIIDTFIKAGYYVEAYQTQSSQDAMEQVKMRGGEFDLVVCSGGDGTLNETISGLMTLENRPVLGYIPAGSTNDFAVTLGLPKKMLDAAEVAVNGTEQYIDVGEFNGRNFVYVACFGAFADVSYQTPQDMKNVLGHSAYIVEAIKSLPSLKNYKVKCEFDGCTIEGEFMYGMVTNSASVGGIKGITGRDISLNDGLFEVTLVKPPKNPLELQAILTDLISGAGKCENVIRFKADKLSFTSDEVLEWVLDGEFGGNLKEVNIENRKNAILFRTKESKKKNPKK